MGREELLTAGALKALCADDMAARHRLPQRRCKDGGLKPQAPHDFVGSERMNALAEIADPQPVDVRHLVAIQMADEGIPVLAIARSTNIPSSDLYELFRDAKLDGRLIDIPPNDWPPGQARATRILSNTSPLNNEDNMRIACVRHFKTSRLEASMLMQLLRREHATKQQLHVVVETNRASPCIKDETDIKMVDVIICKLRKKLVAHSVVIETVWGIGYLIKPDMRQLCLDILASA